MQRRPKAQAVFTRPPARSVPVALGLGTAAAVGLGRYRRQLDSAELDVHLVLDTSPLTRHPWFRPGWRRIPGAADSICTSPPHQLQLGQSDGSLVQRTDRQALHRRVFTNVPALIDAIELWVSHWNDDPKPFVWHAPAADIIAKVRRGWPSQFTTRGREAGPLILKRPPRTPRWSAQGPRAARAPPPPADPAQLRPR